MTVDKNTVVSVSYELRANDSQGEIIEVTEKVHPFEFIFGSGYTLEKFDEKLKGLKAGDAFSFVLSADDAYGQINEDAVLELPKSVFEVDGEIEEGLLEVDNVVPMQDKDGNHYEGIVLEVADDYVVLDFNHPLAGEDLCFTGEVIGVRAATQAELEHGHVHHECTGCGKH